MKWGTLKKTSALFFAVLLLVPSVLLVHPRDVQGQLEQLGGRAVVVVADTSKTSLVQTIKATLSEAWNFISSGANTTTAINTTAMNFRESVLNPLAWYAAKAVIRGVTRSIVNWIRNGFKGGPGFVTDPEAFLAQVVDEAIGEFIYGSELSFLCSPFQLDVRIALGLNYNRPRELACRLSDIENNIQNFFSGVQGSFVEQGWGTWLQVVTSDNPYNKLMLANTEAQIRIASAREGTLLNLNWGRGFLPFKECTTVLTPTAVGGRAIEKEECKTVTPGAYIETQLANVGGSWLRQLELADSINEILGELALQLVSQAMGGAGGLLGGGGSNYSVPNYNLPGDFVLPPNYNLATDSNPRVAEEQNYKATLKTTLDRVVRAEQQILLAPACAAVSVAGAVANKTGPLKAELSRKMSEADTAVIYLRDLDQRLKTANTTQAADAAAREYSNPPEGIVLHSIRETAEARLQQETITREMDQLEQQIASEGAACEAARRQAEGTAVNAISGGDGGGAGADGSPGGAGY